MTETTDHPPLNYSGPADAPLLKFATALRDACLRDGEVEKYCYVDNAFYFRVAAIEGHRVDVRIASHEVLCFEAHCLVWSRQGAPGVALPFDGTYLGLRQAVSGEVERLSQGGFSLDQALGRAKAQLRERGEELPPTERQQRFMEVICVTLDLIPPPEATASVSGAMAFIDQHADTFYQRQQEERQLRAKANCVAKGLLVRALLHRGVKGVQLPQVFGVKKPETVRRYWEGAANWWAGRGTGASWMGKTRLLVDVIVGQHELRGPEADPQRVALRDRLLSEVTGSDALPDVLRWAEDAELRGVLADFLPAASSVLAKD